MAERSTREEELKARLDSIAEELADLALARLQDAVSDGDSGAQADERRLTRARRAVEKAAHLLDSDE